MTIFQILMLGASAFFAFRIYEHIQTLQDKPQKDDNAVRNNSYSSFDPESLIEKADEAYENNELQKALSLLIEADSKRAGDGAVLFKIGYILQKLQQYDDSLLYYKEALEIDSENEFIHNAMASIYRVKKEFAMARIHLEESLKLDADNAITYFNYGNLLVDMELLEEAKEAYKNAILLKSDFKEAQNELQELEIRAS